LVFIAVIIYISSFLSGILTLFLSVIYHDHLNYLLKLIHINIKNYYLGEYIICIFSFFLGIYLGFYINKLLLIKFKVISKEDINKLNRINRFRIKL
jgi:uncharacterized membrane protein YdjX (TVP38/TMEM64 family)